MFVFPISIFAIVSFAFLSLRTPLFRSYKSKSDLEKPLLPKISIVIPARNEQDRLPTLLKSVSAQTFAPHEIIVVDDQSSDATASIAAEFGALVVKTENRPVDFAPKAFACEIGFKKSNGDIVIFLDADTNLSPLFIERVTDYFMTSKKDVLTLQPFHETKSFIQSMSMFFHVVSIVGSGLLSIKPFQVGLYGPCIAIRRDAYELSGGFSNASVRNSLVEDIELGKVLKCKNVEVDRFLGTGLIEYSMYQDFKHMQNGWIKNITSGAGRTPILVLLSIVGVVGSLIAVPLKLATYGHMDAGFALLSMQWIILWLLVVNTAIRLGTYFRASIFYPLSLGVFLYIFIISLFYKITNKDVDWAGRKLSQKLKK